MSKPTTKGVPVAPLTGVLDCRSEPNLMPGDALRMRQNFQTVGQNKIRRGTGWTKLLDDGTYNNEDFHDQLAFFTSTIRQPVTLLFETNSTYGTRSLIVGTQCTIARLNEYSGNYEILGHGFGGTPLTTGVVPRFRAAQLGDRVYFTNDFDKPMVYGIDEGKIETTDTLLNTMDDLDLIGLTRARVIFSWHNCIFLADVEIDGQRIGYRIMWSDYADGTSWDPAKLDSITGYKDLFSHERILGGAALGSSFFLYTTHGIWEMVVVGGDRSFDFLRRYNGEQNEGAGILKFPNTLVALPDEQLYLAEDGAYAWTPYASRPQRVEWLHRSTPLILDNIDEQACDAHVATAGGNEVLISTAPVGATNSLPNRTLRINTVYKTADYVDHGFTAFCNYQPYHVPTIRDWIIEHGICTLEALIEQGYPLGDEGMGATDPAWDPTLGQPPAHIYTSHDLLDTGGHVEAAYAFHVEDYTQAEPSADSLCALLGGATLDDICRKCEPATLIVAACSVDWCLKQLGGVLYRSRCSNPTEEGAQVAPYHSPMGSYVLDGYDSIIRFAPMWYDAQGEPMVVLVNLKLNAQPTIESPAKTIGLRIGISAEPVDSNDADANIVWHQHALKNLVPNTAKTPAQHATDKTIPIQPIDWPLYRVGRCLHGELKITGTYGDATFAGVKAEIGLKDAKRF